MTEERKRTPEPTGSFLKRTIRDGFRFYLEQPYTILIASFLSIIPVWLYPQALMSDFNPFDKNFGSQELIQLFNDLSAYIWLSIIVTLIGRAIVFFWSNQARLSQPWNIQNLIKGLFRIHRVIIGVLIALLAFLVLLILITPLLFLTLISKELIIIYFLAAILVLAFYIVMWQPKFEYMMAGLVITKEPVSVLWNEWRKMPQWLWLRFLLILGLQVFVQMVIMFLTIPFKFISNGILSDLLQGFFIAIGINICIGIFGISFVRSRDEWAEMTETQPSEYREIRPIEKDDWTD